MQQLPVTNYNCKVARDIIQVLEQLKVVTELASALKYVMKG